MLEANQSRSESFKVKFLGELQLKNIPVDDPKFSKNICFRLESKSWKLWLELVMMWGCLRPSVCSDELSTISAPPTGGQRSAFALIYFTALGNERWCLLDFRRGAMKMPKTTSNPGRAKVKSRLPSSHYSHTLRLKIALLTAAGIFKQLCQHTILFTINFAFLDKVMWPIMIVFISWLLTTLYMLV